jgi:hypothetical protein
MKDDRMLPRHAYHKPFTVKFPDICEWQAGLTQTTKGARSGTQTVPRPFKVLVPGCIDGAQEKGTAAVLGSTTQYSRLKYVIKACKIKKVNVKQSRNRPGVAQRVPGGLGSQIFMTLGT